MRLRELVTKIIIRLRVSKPRQTYGRGYTGGYR